MISQDFNTFKMAMTSAHAMSANGKIHDDGTMSMMFDLLKEYSLADVKSAIAAHCKRDRFAPTPADICQIINERTGSVHPGADEAWAIMRKSFDERETVVCTAQMLEAKSAADDVLDYGGSQFDASRAFKDAYNRIINATDAPVKWQASYGTDKNQKLRAISEAVDKGRLPTSALTTPRIEHDAQNITTTVAGLIESAQAHPTTPEVAKSCLKGILDDLNAKSIAENEIKIAESRARIAKAQAEKIERDKAFVPIITSSNVRTALSAIDRAFELEFKGVL